MEPFGIYMARTGQRCVSQAAAARSHGVWQMLVASPLPVPAGLHAVVGFFIDCHIPAMRWKLDVMALYASGKAPEMCSSFPIGSYPHPPDRSMVSKAWHTHMYHEVVDLASKLMRKGGPTPCSVRYVSGLLRRCSEDAATASLARRIFVLSILGNYRSSRTCPDPSRRAAVYAMDVRKLCGEVCNSRTTRQLHTMLVRYVASHTSEIDSLCWSIGVRGRWANVHSLLAAPPLSAPPPDTYAVVSILYKARQVKRINFRSLSSERQADLRRAIAAVSGSQASFSVPHSALVDLGMPKRDVDAVVDCFPFGTGPLSLKMMRARLRVMSPKSRAIIADILWASAQKISVSVTPLPAEVADAQEAAWNARCQYPPIVPICTTCAFFNSTVHGVSVPKTRIGAAVNMGSGSLRCGVCRMTSVVPVHAIGRCIRVFRQRVLLHSATVCCRCARLTAKHTKIGIYPVCSDCAPDVRSDLASGLACHCGRPAAVSGLVAKCRGDSVLYGLCEVHRHLACDDAPELSDLHDIISGHSP